MIKGIQTNVSFANKEERKKFRVELARNDATLQDFWRACVHLSLSDSEWKNDLFRVAHNIKVRSEK